MKASILTIGDEILIGQIVDTNSASIARHLNNAGIVVWERTSVGDQREQITEAVKRAMNQSDVVILTGGLGPTKDDITKKTLAELFGSRLVCDQTVADHVRRMLEARGIEYNRLNRDQALVPACCTVLFNAHGTAPGMWFEQNGKVVVSLPGVPFEMEHLMTDEVMPRLKARFSLLQIVPRPLITAGLAESMLAEKIADWENALPPYLHLAYLPAPGVVRLRLSAYEVEGESVSHEIDRQFAALQRIIPRYVLGFERATMQEIVHNLLTQRRQTLATAESCTGGSIAPASRQCPEPRPISCAEWWLTATNPKTTCWVSIPKRSPAGAPSARRSHGRWPKEHAASPEPTMPSQPPASQVLRAVRNRNPSARSGWP